MPMGSPQAYGGPMMGQGMVGNQMNLQVLQALAEERKAREEQGILTLLGGLALAGAMEGGKEGKKGEGGMVKSEGKGAPSGHSMAGKHGKPASRGAGGPPALHSGGQAVHKTDPMSLMSAAGATANVAGGAGKAALLSSPVVGASISGAATLADGLMGGGEGDELQKKALKTNRQESLFGSVAALTDSLRRRNEEIRASFARA